MKNAILYSSPFIFSETALSAEVDISIEFRFPLLSIFLSFGCDYRRMYLKTL